MSLELYLVFITLILAILHMLAPDHWIPLSILSAKRKYSNGRTAYYGFAIGTVHGILSSALALVIAFLGISFLGYGKIKIASIVLLAAVCVYILLNAFKERKAERNVENTSLLVSIIPDPAFLPIILSSAIFGYFFISFISVLFVVAGGLSLLVVTLLAHKGMLKSLEKVRPDNVDYVVVAVLLLTALFIYFT
ncbi:MAG: hypothetical protein M1113_03385 [Candidatus Thermoplasmatota archaeon]|nr:hypothetical protein [Candidatus Thermoplasmatota archaeon]